MVQGIRNDKNALGFFGLAYFTENQDKLKLVAVNNGNGPILPTEQTVKDKTYAPLSRPLFIYVSKKAAARKEVSEFVKFYLANTKTLTKDVGYISLTDQEIEAEVVKFKTFTGETK